MKRLGTLEVKISTKHILDAVRGVKEIILDIIERGFDAYDADGDYICFYCGCPQSDEWDYHFPECAYDRLRKLLELNGDTSEQS